jgi:hypothetical protein
MMIDTNIALTAFDDIISWKLRPALDPDRIFDELANRFRQHPRFRDLKISELDLLLADLKREFVHNMHVLEWALYTAFKTMLGEDA